TKPTQHSVKQLLEFGVQPDILVCRTEHELPASVRTKVAKFCNVKPQAVIQSIDASTIYDVPMLMLEEGFDTVVLQELGIKVRKKPDLKKWEKFLFKYKNPKDTVRIGLIGKYVELKDSYKSIVEAFNHAGAENEVKVEIDWIHSEEINMKNAGEILKDLHGILVAPGFGSRGIDGKIEAIQYAREHKVPFFGICLGMQCAVIEYARNVLGWKDAHSTEMKEYTNFPVISLMAEQKSISNLGGTMRLGSFPCELKKGTKAYEAYKSTTIDERHRHRFEFNNDYMELFENSGMKATGINPDSGLVEIVEIPDHPWFVGAQFHPEYKSTVAVPHPLFVAFVNAVSKQKASASSNKATSAKA
ncbi:MAG: CTP synthase, partial [Flavobacteriales bacterium]